MKKIIWMFMVLLMVLSGMARADTEVYGGGTSSGWTSSTNCSSTVSNGVGCYNTSTHILCIGNGTSCVPTYNLGSLTGPIYAAAGTPAAIAVPTDGLAYIMGFNTSGVYDKYRSLALIADYTPLYDAVASSGAGAKIMRFDVSPVASGGTSVLSVPATSDTLVGIAASQTLTNKVLTAPTINNGTIATATLTSPYIQQNELLTYYYNGQRIATVDTYSTIINNFLATTSHYATLPTAGFGMNILYIIGSTTSATSGFMSASGANIWHNGTRASGARLSNTQVGDYMVWYSFKTGATTWSWIVKQGQGTFATF
jgi:hypothetical protein